MRVSGARFGPARPGPSAPRLVLTVLAVSATPKIDQCVLCRKLVSYPNPTTESGVPVRRAIFGARASYTALDAACHVMIIVGTTMHVARGARKSAIAIHEVQRSSLSEP